MKTTIFVVTGSSGEYSDRNDWNICAFSSKDLANDFIVKSKLLDEFNATFRQRLVEEVDTGHNASFSVQRTHEPPYPEVTPDFRKVIEACAYGKGSPEDKVIHKELQKQHLTRIDSWRKACQEINIINSRILQQFEEERKAWIDKNYNPLPELQAVIPFCSKNLDKYAGAYHSKIRYDIDKLELVE